MYLLNDSSPSLKPEVSALMQLFEALAAMPMIASLLQEQNRQLSALREEMRQHSNAAPDPDRWLDAKAAAEYLGLSATTFDKYRYQSRVRIKGYRVGGKFLYQRKDLDSFVKLYEFNSAA